MIGYGFHDPWTEGCAIIARDLALTLQDQARVSIISVIDHFRGFRRGKLDDITTRFLDSNYIFRWPKKFGKYLMIDKMVDSVKLWRILRSINSQHEIDIVHVYNISHFLTSAIAKKLLGKNVVAHVVGLSGAFDIGDMLSNRFVDAYICTSEYTWAHLVKRGVPRKKVHIVPPIIHITERHYKKKSMTSNDSFIIGYMGHLYPKRLPLEVIVKIGELLEKRNNVELLICCPDNPRNREISENMKKVLSGFDAKYHILISNLSQYEKTKMYASSDVLIFPFQEEITGMMVIDPPLTILESMAYGRVIVASKVLSIPNIIEHGKNGFLVNPRDFDGFKNAIEYILDNSTTLEFMRENARNTILEKFSPGTISEKVMDVYESMRS